MKTDEHNPSVFIAIVDSIGGNLRSGSQPGVLMSRFDAGDSTPTSLDEQLVAGRELVLSRTEIEMLIPHRPPILMLDRVIACVPNSYGIGERDLHANDTCFAGHFPGRPIVPGAFIIEACGQLIAVVCRAASDRSLWPDHPPIEYLAAVERFKFLSPALPGEVLTVKGWLGRRVGSLLQARVTALVGQRLVADGILNVTASVRLEEGPYRE